METNKQTKRELKQTWKQTKKNIWTKTDEKQTNKHIKHELNQTTNNNNKNNNNIKSRLNTISDSPGKGILNLQHHNAQKNTTPYSDATQIALQ